MKARRGVTLIELLVTLSMLAVLSGVTVMAVRRIDPPRPDEPNTILADSLRDAVSNGRPALVRLLIGGAPVSAIVRPDGGIIADSAFAVDRFTGAPLRAR